MTLPMVGLFELGIDVMNIADMMRATDTLISLSLHWQYVEGLKAPCISAVSVRNVGDCGGGQVRLDLPSSCHRCIG
jgi:hypothetical protein